MITIHERNVVVVIALSACMLCACLILKKYLHMLIYCFSELFFFFVFRMTKRVIIAAFWKQSTGDNLANTSIIVDDFLIPNTIEKCKVLIDIIVSNMIELNISYCGFFAVILIVGIIECVRCLKCFINNKNDVSSYELRNCLVWVLSVGLTVGIIIGMAIQWGSWIYMAQQTGMQLGTAIRSYGYLRYYNCYLGPSLLVSIFWLKKIYKNRLFCKYVLGLNVVMYCYFFKYVYLTLKADGGLLNLISLTDDSILNLFLSLLVSVLPVTVFLMGKKYNNILLIISLILLNIHVGFSMPIINDKNYDAVKLFINEQVVDGDIYVLDDIANYQFFLKDYEIRLWSGEKNVFILSTHILSPEEANYSKLNDFIPVEISNGQYVYIRR